ncbi:hypothetical protein LBMAG42_03540 [Deltaproteobacteria bacterium]|nr:hypothetical protein LBMAG42_03540 [Deltaproteobacteria bacterium]
MSAVLAALAQPFECELNPPDNPEGVAELAELAALAWNVSRFLGGAQNLAGPDLIDRWRALPRGEPRRARIANAILTRCLTLQPADARFVVHTEVVMRDGEPYIRAEFTKLTTPSPAPGGRRP